MPELIHRELVKTVTWEELGGSNGHFGLKVQDKDVHAGRALQRMFLDLWKERHGTKPFSVNWSRFPSQALALIIEVKDETEEYLDVVHPTIARSPIYSELHCEQTSDKNAIAIYEIPKSLEAFSPEKLGVVVIDQDDFSYSKPEVRKKKFSVAIRGISSFVGQRITEVGDTAWLLGNVNYFLPVAIRKTGYVGYLAEKSPEYQEQQTAALAELTLTHTYSSPNEEEEIKTSLKFDVKLHSAIAGDAFTDLEEQREIRTTDANIQIIDSVNAIKEKRTAVWKPRKIDW